MRWSTTIVLDALAIVWVLICLVLGLRVANEVRGLSAVSDTVVTTGEEIERTGEALGSLDLPVVGGRLDDVARDVQEAGARTRSSGQRAGRSTAALSTLLGITVAIIPATPLAFFYLPRRIATARERAALRRLAARAEHDPNLERLLAHRALMTLPYRELERLDGRPWADLAAGRYDRLADRERARAA